MKMRCLWLAVALPIALFVFACQTAGKPIDTNLTPLEFFQRAQDASEKGDFQRAVSLYQAFKERYPDDTERNLWASYEIAFLYYKMGKQETALKLFNELLFLYEGGKGQALPAGPRILAEKVKASIEEKKAKKG